ncbi:MAG TPA: 3-deoxy-7-phosphoheptulonate synthase [Bacteroidetes bacterium]|nr:3-deoxy-7-phosphoheptulonate synthase [Bacteroidota bacterium]
MQFQPVFEKKERPILIAGPCSAETEEQVLETARGLKNVGIDLFRAGIWKPRTRPGAFEGVGAPGLKWLQRVKKETGLKVTTEVANTQHVFAAMKHGIDVFWIGARTTVNPFSVQEVADALSGLDVPVLIKNPINADLKLWIGAIERIYKAGITKIGAIHRGFSFHGETKYRNNPLWQLPIELKRQFPDLQIICDNSHICGNRNMLQKVAQQALDLNYDGLMTEVHPTPDNAWSDAAQQITPHRFGVLVKELVVREQTTENTSFLKTIDFLRHEIDEIDAQLMNLFGARMKLSDQIGEYKKENNIAILQPSRWNEILEKAFAEGEEKNLSKRFVETVLRAIHQESISHQTKVMNEEGSRQSSVQQSAV